jgi:hypothetical protein
MAPIHAMLARTGHDQESGRGQFEIGCLHARKCASGCDVLEDLRGGPEEQVARRPLAGAGALHHEDGDHSWGTARCLHP